jgi:hypothetical protein
VLRGVVRSSLVLLLVGPALVLTASPCGACSCAPRTPEQLLRHADAAFVGTVVDQQAIDQVTTIQTFAVRSVFKGDLGPTVRVIDPIGSGGGSTCGILYGAGEVAVILHRQGDGWTTDVCSRITIAQLTGVGPPPVHPSAEPGTSVPPTSAGSGTTGERGGGLSARSLIGGLLLGIAAIALALSLGGRRDRAKARPEDMERPKDQASGPADEAADPGHSG